MFDSLSRRGVLKGLGAGAIGVGIGTATVKAEGSLEDQLAAVREATYRFADVRKALAAGFKPLGPAVCGMGWHFLHPGRVEAAITDGLDRTVPQLLVYGVDGGGDLVLGAVEYGIPVGARGYDGDSPPDLFDDDGGERWHVHHARYHVFARPAGERRGRPGFEDVVDSTNWAEVHGDAFIADPHRDGPDEGDVVKADFDRDGRPEPRRAEAVARHPDLWTLHAWVHAENGEGVFVPFNSDPRFAPADCTPVPHGE